MLRPRILLVLLYAVLCSVVTVWVLLDRRPPEWDHANHLERAVDCHRSLRIVADTGTREILEASSLYPPLVRLSPYYVTGPASLAFPCRSPAAPRDPFS
jgi:hypothetical protein